MDAKLADMMAYIGMRGLLANWDDYISIAEKKDFSHVAFLKYMRRLKNYIEITMNQIQNRMRDKIYLTLSQNCAQLIFVD